LLRTHYSNSLNLSIQRVILGFPILAQIGQVRSLHYIIHCHVLREVQGNLSKINGPELFAWGKSRTESEKDAPVS